MARPNPKKKKAEALSTITNRLDRKVSKIVRLRDKSCVTCGSTDTPQAGHFEARGHLATRWDLTNVHQQCSACNLYLKGNMVAYYHFIQRKYGDDYPQTLHDLARGPAPKRAERYAIEAELDKELARLEALQ